MTEKEIRHQPEQEANEKTSFREIISGLKKRLIESLTEIFYREPEAEERVIDQELEMYKKTLKHSLLLGRAAGNFFRLLLLESLQRPVRAYTDIKQDSLHEQLDTLDQISEIPGEERTELRREVQEATDEFGVIQKGYFTTRQRDSPNFIYEAVGNRFVDIEGQKFNIAASNVMVKDSNTGTRLHLSTLLPDGFSLAPSEMQQIKKEADWGNLKVILTPTRSDLNSYQGGGGLSDEFYLSLAQKRIFYGNLKESAGFLSLLHEISHAWQQVYRSGSEDVKLFLDAVTEIEASISFVIILKQAVEKGETDVHVAQTMTDDIKSKLQSKYGVEFDEETLKSSGELKQGEFRLSTLLNGAIVIKSSMLDSLIADFEAEERDAWAHAIRVLKFLKKRGLDLEPNIKTLKDVQSVVNPCLGSYQENIGKMIESSTRKVRFVK